MANDEREEAKVRIVNASIQLFSEKGYDATRVNEIADAAGVNKALIYYYFKSKEDILDYLLHTFYENLKSRAMTFVQENIVHMIEDGRLDIEGSRFHFKTKDDIDTFTQGMRSYYQLFLDYLLENRQLIRILLLESLKNSKHQADLFGFSDLMQKSSSNPLYKTIYDADQDFDYPDYIVEFKFFNSLMPMLSFAAYYDDWKRIRGITDEQMRESFLRSLEKMMSFLVSGQDILIEK